VQERLNGRVYVYNGEGNDNMRREHVEHVGVRMCVHRRDREFLVCDARRFYFYSEHGQKIALQVTCDDS